MNIELRNPYDGEVVFDQPSETIDSVDRKIAQARSAARIWRRIAPAERARIVRDALVYFQRHREEIAMQVTSEVGKPLAEALSEVDYMVDRAEWMCRFVDDGCLEAVNLQAYETADFLGSVKFAGKGVVYIIAPWNYPLFCAINGTVCALLSGSAVVLKHTTAPSVGRHFESAFSSLGGMEGLLANIVVDYDVSAQIIESSDIDHVIFTGSVNAGRSIQASIAKRACQNIANPFIGVSLELGSNDATYISDDADLASAIEWTVRIGRLHNSGQSCCAVKRAFVHENLYDRYVEAAARVMEQIVQGDPAQEGVTMGPLFGGEAAVLRLKGMVDGAVGQGARLAMGGRIRHIGPAMFLEPTLLAEASPEMEVMREETFGPVLPVMKVHDDNEAIEAIVDSRHGLTASIFTRSREKAEDFVAAMECGTVYVNRCNFVDARLGWIGHKNSGNGAISLSPLGLQTLSRLQSVNVDPTLFRG